jgi:bisanhydrobacterioruberin hydratase
MSVFRTFLASLTVGFSSASKRTTFVTVLLLSLFLYPFGLLFVAAGVLPGEFDWTASIIIGLYGVIVFLSEHRSRISSSSLFRVAGVLVLVYLLEYIGVREGFPFGKYEYTPVLGFQIVSVPVAIVLAWYSTIMMSRRIAAATVRLHGSARRPTVALLAGLLTVALDVALEPMAAFIKQYWIWSEDSVPIQNYISWFLISSVIVYIQGVGGEKDESFGSSSYRLAVLVFLMQLSLFILTGVANGFLLAPMIAAAITVLVLLGAKVSWPATGSERMVQS